jgi:hypothetical protein
MPKESEETNIVEFQQEFHGAIEFTKEEDSMIAVLATKDPHGYPFWIRKVIKIEKENVDVVTIEVHWYATNTHSFNSVYKPEMVVDKNVNRKRKRKGQNTTHRRTDLLKLDDVDILVYDFNLTKRGTLRSKTT